MEFLRRLAPVRESDASRATAVLPSRFDSEGPLRRILAQVPLAQPLEEGESSPSFDATPATGTVDGAVAERHPVAPVAPSYVESRRLASGRANGVTEVPPAHTSPAVLALESRLPQASPQAYRRSVEGANPVRAEQRILGTGPGSEVGAVASPGTQPRVPSPLSGAVLAQRSLPSREESQVVHVTIGRIDVVASKVPTPPVRSGAAPREPTRTLTDYLRRDSGSSR
jgi:hypothetical protein